MQVIHADQCELSMSRGSVHLWRGVALEGPSSLMQEQLLARGSQSLGLSNHTRFRTCMAREMQENYFVVAKCGVYFTDLDQA